MAKEKLKVVKRLPNGSALFNNGMVRTPPCRLMFVNFAKAKEKEDDDGNVVGESYGCAALFKKKEDISLLKLACDKFAISELGEKKAKRYKRRPFRDQAEKSDTYEGYVDGAMFLNCSSKFKPRVTGPQKDVMEPGEFYSGCWARLTLSPYHYNQKGNAGIALGLTAAQFLKDGERVGGGGVDPDDVFDEEDVEDMADEEYESKASKGGKKKPKDDDDDNDYI